MYIFPELLLTKLAHHPSNGPWKDGLSLLVYLASFLPSHQEEKGWVTE